MNIVKFEDYDLYEDLDALLLEYSDKDLQRIEDFFSKSKGSMEKIKQLANTMASRITNAEKAFGRAQAALDVQKTRTGPEARILDDVAKIFYDKAKSLGVKEIIPSLEGGSTSTPSATATPAAKPAKPAAKPAKQPEEDKAEIASSAKPPASTWPVDKRFTPAENPYKSAKDWGNAVQLKTQGIKVNLRSNTDIENMGDGTIEVWEIMSLVHAQDGDYALIVTSEDEPTCGMGTKAYFRYGSSKLFKGKMVDYTPVSEAKGLAEKYGTKFKYYEHV